MQDLSWDYLTVSSWLGVDEKLLDAVIDDRVEKAKRLQYVGQGRDGEGGYFFGQAIQNDGRHGESLHYLFSASGSSAEKCRPVQFTGTPTRLDCQVTAVRPESFELSQVAMALQSKLHGPFQRRGRYPAIKVILSDTTTIYVGRRGKSRMFRIYEKYVDGRHCVRFEVEYARDLAGKGAERRSNRQLASLLLSEFRTLPQLTQYALFFVGDRLKELSRGDEPRLFKDKAESKTYEWLLNALQVGYRLEICETEEQRVHLQSEVSRLADYLKRCS